MRKSQLPKPPGFAPVQNPQQTEKQIRERFITILVGFAKIIPLDQREIPEVTPESSSIKTEFIRLLSEKEYCAAAVLIRKSDFTLQDLVEWFQDFMLLGTITVFADPTVPLVQTVRDTLLPLEDRIHACFELWTTQFDLPEGAPPGAALSAIQNLLTNYGADCLSQNLRVKHAAFWEAEDSLAKAIEAGSGWVAESSGMSLTDEFEIDPLMPWRDLTVVDPQGAEINFRLYPNPRRAYTGVTLTPTLLKIVEEWEAEG